MIGLLLLLLGALVLVLVVLAAVCASAAWNPPRRATGWALAHGEPSVPSEKDIPYEEWTLDRPDGAQLCVWDVPGENPDLPCLVLLHGWSRSKLTWLIRLHWWRARSSRLLILDLRGHGDSTPDGATMGEVDAADVEALVERAQATNVVLVGRSLGSVIAIHAAARCAESLPGVVQGVLAIAPYEHLSKTIHARLIQRSLPAQPVVPLAMALLRLRGVRSEPTTRAAARLQAELLVIQGSKDPISSTDDARRIAAAAPHGRLIEVAEAHHGDHWDIEGKRLDDEVESFLKSVGKTSEGSSAAISRPAS